MQGARASERGEAPSYRGLAPIAFQLLEVGRKRRTVADIVKYTTEQKLERHERKSEYERERKYM